MYSKLIINILLAIGLSGSVMVASGSASDVDTQHQDWRVVVKLTPAGVNASKSGKLDGADLLPHKLDEVKIEYIDSDGNFQKFKRTSQLAKGMRSFHGFELTFTNKEDLVRYLKHIESLNQREPMITYHYAFISTPKTN